MDDFDQNSNSTRRWPGKWAERIAKIGVAAGLMFVPHSPPGTVPAISRASKAPTQEYWYSDIDREIAGLLAKRTNVPFEAGIAFRDLNENVQLTYSYDLTIIIVGKPQRKYEPFLGPLLLDNGLTGEVITDARDSAIFEHVILPRNTFNELLNKIGATEQYQRIAKREGAATKIIGEIKQGKYGGVWQGSLEHIERVYGQWPNTDRDRDGRPDTAVMILSQLSRDTNRDDFITLTLDEANAKDWGNRRLGEIKKGKYGAAATQELEKLDREFGKGNGEWRRIYLRITSPAESHEIVAKIGPAIGHPEWARIPESIISVPFIRALDNIRDGTNKGAGHKR